MTCAPEAESRLPVGSSARMMGGFAAIARAIATRCCYPARKLGGVVVHPVAHPHPLKRGNGQLAALAAGDAAVDERQLDVFQRGQAGDEVEALEDEADPPVADAGEGGLGDVGDVLPVEEIDPSVGQVEAAEHVHEGRFARPRLPDDRHELPRLDREGNAAERAHLVVAGVINFAQVPQFHKRHNKSPTDVFS